jgi:uncharacterized membrane protein YedE/YeeE
MESIETKETYYSIFIKKEWSYTVGAVVMSLFAVLLAAFAGSWGVSGPLAIWGGKALALIGIDADSWEIFNGSIAKYSFVKNQGAITDVALTVGAAISCLLAAQWKLRNIKSVRQIWAAIFGGFLMGIGARINPGCNIGAMFSSIPAFNVSGWIFLFFVFLGAVVGGKLLTRFFMPPVSHERREQRKKLSMEQRKRNRSIQIICGIVLVVLCFIFALATGKAAPSAGFMLFIGLALGYSLQHSRFCFTAAYRDPSLTGNTRMFRALLVALAVSTIGFAGIHMSRYGVDLSKLPENFSPSPIGLHLFIGAFIFGIGAVLAGGCASGTFVRVGEGYVQNMIALVFFIAGSIVGIQIMNTVVMPNPLLYSGKGVYLPKVLGGFGPAILLQLLLLFVLWIVADQWEKRKTAQFNSKG